MSKSMGTSLAIRGLSIYCQIPPPLSSQVYLFLFLSSLLQAALASPSGCLGFSFRFPMMSTAARVVLSPTLRLARLKQRILSRRILDYPLSMCSRLKACPPLGFHSHALIVIVKYIRSLAHRHALLLAIFRQIYTGIPGALVITTFLSPLPTRPSIIPDAPLL